MRALRRAIELSLPILGMAVVFGGVLFIPGSRLQFQIVVVLLGVLMLEAGVWGLTNQLLPNERTYVALRAEGDRFIDLIRNLNAAAVDRDTGAEQGEERFRKALVAMHDSVDIMGEVAGKKT